ncbi:Protein of unknown function [Cotesia congregata]|uniref:Uncharacterized protein n=1 Tax=Cotesia congregata TaxID=51543 RepID=A0A8J2MMY4_COTCN|nr:Protein of unknown function [Cotesia congregata]
MIFCIVPKQNKKILTYRRFSDLNNTALSNSLMLSLNIGRDSLNELDPNSLLDIFLTNVINVLDEFAPLYSRTVFRSLNP